MQSPEQDLQTQEQRGSSHTLEKRKEKKAGDGVKTPQAIVKYN